MLGSGAAGTLGLLLQGTVFAVVVLLSARRVGVSRALVYGGVVAVYGYALVVSFTSLLGVPWPVTNVLASLGVVVLVIAPPVRASIAEGLGPVLLALRRAWFPVVVVGIVMAYLVMIAEISPELSIDGQLYHGPILADIVQTGSLWGWLAPNQYMFYTDLTMAGGVNLATFAGDARFDNALQLPHLLLLIFIINWALGRRFRSPFVRVAIAAVIVAAPVIWLQPRILYVDVAYGAAVAGAIFAVVLIREFAKFDMLVVGILVAAVFATKPTGILTGAILLIALLVVVFRRRGGVTLHKTLAVASVGVGLPLLMGMSFYLRNLVQFGNPIYPVQATMGPFRLPGILDISIFASGERGSGFVDPGRWISYASSLKFGMLHGIAKFDYDPRVGGFGRIPLFVLILAVALVAVQLVGRLRGKTSSGAEAKGEWKLQVAVASLAAAVLLVQPSTFDARYVIGPTVVVLVALMLTNFGEIAPRVSLIVGWVSLFLAFGQVVWTEHKMYPGIDGSLYLIHAPADAQPVTPANPWGEGLAVAWLPSDGTGCLTIALQTSGGVKPWGMSESSFLGTLPYGLYGDHLCNRVFPVTLGDQSGGVSSTDEAAILGADYLVLYGRDVAAWERGIPGLAECLTAVSSIDGSSGYPQNELVFHNSCT